MELTEGLLERDGVTLHYWTGGKAGAPLVVFTYCAKIDHHEWDATGNIRKVMPMWASREPDCRFVVIPEAKHAANLDSPELFHKTLLDFLTSRCL